VTNSKTPKGLPENFMQTIDEKKEEDEKKA